MGLLGSSHEEDVQFVSQIAALVAEFWNENGGPEHGFEVYVGQQQIAEVCKQAELIFSHSFPDSPGAFKRVATLIVLGRLFPYFGLGHVKGTEFKYFEPPAAHDIWLPRILALMIPATLSVMSVNVGKGGHETWVSMPSWKGFPSKHFKIEFLTFLRWLDNFGYYPPTPKQPWDEAMKNRLARIILVTAMIIESVYYGSEAGMTPVAKKSDIRGKCESFDGEDMTAVTYDVYLAKAARAQHNH